MDTPLSLEQALKSLGTLPNNLKIIMKIVLGEPLQEDELCDEIILVASSQDLALEDPLLWARAFLYEQGRDIKELSRLATTRSDFKRFISLEDQAQKVKADLVIPNYDVSQEAIETVLALKSSIENFENLKKNSEVRIQESESISGGFRPATELLHH
ncbi:hypothetical protein [uncultured Nostoc sp.]|uniref:hypothetical protein n=1 Tax=uncultured Nostoc sp. TaxID=340711 RepID=UPI0035CBFA71